LTDLSTHHILQPAFSYIKFTSATFLARPTGHDEVGTIDLRRVQ
jgi:hypothetical protein